MLRFRKSFTGICNAHSKSKTYHLGLPFSNCDTKMATFSLPLVFEGFPHASQPVHHLFLKSFPDKKNCSYFLAISSNQGYG